MRRVLGWVGGVQRQGSLAGGEFSNEEGGDLGAFFGGTMLGSGSG